MLHVTAISLQLRVLHVMQLQGRVLVQGKRSAVMMPAEVHSQGVRVNQSESSKQYSDQSEGLIPAPNMVSPRARVSELDSLQINFVEKKYYGTRLD